MSTATSTLLVSAPVVLTPSTDPTPVEKAVVDGILGDFEPETFLWVNFHRPDGGVRVWYAWTAGGAPLGNRIDGVAMAAGFDSADWFHLTNRHLQTSSRGRINIQAHPLRPILADLQAGHRATGEERDQLRRVIVKAVELTGEVLRPGLPRWLGVGPALLMQGAKQ